MARTPIDSAPKRAKLAPRKNPYWTALAGGRGGVSLGYRRAEKGPGTWIAKLVLDKRRLEERLGTADDAGAEGAVLSFAQATSAALSWAKERAASVEAERDGRTGGDPTVRTAIEEYISERVARSKRLGGDAASRLKLHALSDDKFASTPLRKLTASTIKAWRNRLSKPAGKPTQDTANPAAKRGRPGAPDLAPASVNRLLNDVRAALNAAAEMHRRELPANITAEIRIGTRAIPDATEVRRQILSDADVRRVVDAAYQLDETGDFGRLVLLLAATGARFAQVSKLTVADVQAEAGRLMVPPAAKGRSKREKAKIAVPVGEDVLERLKPVLAGRRGHEPLLERWRHRQIAPAKWERVSRGAWTAAAEMTRPWKTAVAEAGLPEDTDAYALRHSSIVRALRANVPLRVVAALHDTSAAMIEKHYAAFILDGTEDLVRRALVPLAPAGPVALRVVSG